MNAFKILRYVISVVLMFAFLSIPWLYGTLTDQQLIVIYLVNWMWMAALSPQLDSGPDSMASAQGYFTLVYALSLLLLFAAVSSVLAASKVLALMTLTVYVARIGLILREELS